MAHVLAGGHDLAARDIVERTTGPMRAVPLPATEFDHVGDLSAPLNLRLLCSGCQAGQAWSHGRHGAVKTDAQVDALFDSLTSRIDGLTPMRACDAGESAAQVQRCQ